MKRAPMQRVHQVAVALGCHCGVTLAANHALAIATMIGCGVLDVDRVGAFFARRFHVQKE
jgi:hypothetical protein